MSLETFYSVSPQGVAATPMTSTTVVVVQGTNGPQTMTRQVVVYAAQETAPMPDTSTQPLLQSIAPSSHVMPLLLGICGILGALVPIL